MIELDEGFEYKAENTYVSLTYNFQICWNPFYFFFKSIFSGEKKDMIDGKKQRIKVSVFSCRSQAVSDPHNSSIGGCLLLPLLRWRLSQHDVGEADQKSMRLINSGE